MMRGHRQGRRTGQPPEDRLRPAIHDFSFRVRQQRQWPVADSPHAGIWLDPLVFHNDGHRQRSGAPHVPKSDLHGETRPTR
jgi:hypothetical protein